MGYPSEEVLQYRETVGLWNFVFLFQGYNEHGQNQKLSDWKDDPVFKSTNRLKQKHWEAIGNGTSIFVDVPNGDPE